MFPNIWLYGNSPNIYSLNKTITGDLQIKRKNQKWPYKILWTEGKQKYTSKAVHIAARLVRQGGH